MLLGRWICRGILRNQHGYPNIIGPLDTCKRNTQRADQMCELTHKTDKANPICSREHFCEISLPNLFFTRTYGSQMEAGGFEPPSRDVSRQASTCLVVLLFFRLAKSQTTGCWLGYFGKVLPKPARTTGSASLLFDALARPTGKIRQDGPPIKQPCATDSCRLKVVAG